jgi:capsular polysaccharide biosynthesis protein
LLDRALSTRVARAGLGLLPSLPVTEDVREWSSEHGIPSVQVFAPRSFERHPPHTIEPAVDPEFLTRLEVRQRGRYLVPIDHALITGRNGLVVLPDGSYAAESVYNRALLEEDPAYWQRRRRPRVRKPGTYFSLVVKWAVGDPGNYYHWMHDTLQRLFGVMEHLPEDTKFIVPSNPSPLRLETLRLLGVNEDQLAYFSGDETWELERLYFAPPTSSSGSHRADADHWLRDKILDGLGVAAQPPHRRIFVSRRRMPRRRLANEADVEACLSQFGFETCLPETLSLKEQVQLFAEAKVVVSTHGAAFTNALFSPEGLVLVDMVEPSQTPWSFVYWAMSEELGHTYWYFTGDSVSRAGQLDTFVPIPKLAATLERLRLSPIP